jgi:hypothetical protein
VAATETTRPPRRKPMIAKSRGLVSMMVCSLFG